MQALKRLNTNSAADRVVVNKLLRSIKRRQQHLQNISTPKNPGKDLRRKLNFATVKKTQSSITTTVQKNPIRLKSKDKKVEEGEILSSDDDDDCIFIEPKVELITIDDENHCIVARRVPPQSIEIAPTKQSDNVVKSLMAITSTPLERNKTKTLQSSASGSPSLAANTKLKNGVVNSDTNADDVVLFFEDVSRLNWLETITSEDTFADYVKTTTPLGSGEDPARRSRRLRGQDAEIIVDDIIFLDDYTLKPEPPRIISKDNRNRNSVIDDSVVFVNEQTPNEFIPLHSDDVPNVSLRNSSSSFMYV